MDGNARDEAGDGCDLSPGEDGNRFHPRGFRSILFIIAVSLRKSPFFSGAFTVYSKSNPSFNLQPAREPDESTSTPSCHDCTCRLRTPTHNCRCCTCHFAVRVRGCENDPARLRRSHLQPYSFSLCAVGAAAAAAAVSYGLYVRVY